MTLLRRTVAALVATLTTGLVLVTAAPASASRCVPQDQVPQSSHVFVGTVLETRHGGRLATVRTSDGRQVQVQGGPGRPETVTTVDRTFEVGKTYEFHPINAASPYQVSTCDRTQEIAAPVSQPANVEPPAGIRPLPGTFWTDFPFAATAVGAGAIAVLISGSALVLLRRKAHADHSER